MSTDLIELWREDDSSYPMELSCEYDSSGISYEIGVGPTSLLIMSREQAEELYKGLRVILGKDSKK